MIGNPIKIFYLIILLSAWNNKMFDEFHLKVPIKRYIMTVSRILLKILIAGQPFNIFNRNFNSYLQTTLDIFSLYFM